MNVIHRHRYAFVLIAAIVLFWTLGLTQHLGAGRDDTFITLYAGQALANGQGIVNHNGERLEMSSSLLHTLLIAAIDIAAPNYVFTLNKLAGGIGATLTLVVLYAGRAVLFQTGRARFIAYATTMLLVASNPAFLYWTFGGLETPFAALFLTAFGVSLLRHRYRATVANESSLIAAQCLYFLTRPEGFYLMLFTAIYLGFMRFLGRRAFRWRILIVPLLFSAAVTAFRWIYFGDLLPNTVYAKGAGLSEGLANGWVYVRNFYDASAFLWLALAVQAALFFFYFSRIVIAAKAYPQRESIPLAGILLFGLVVAGQLVAIVAGGDWMEHFRFFVPVLPLMCVMVVSTVTNGVRTIGMTADKRGPAVAAMIVVAIVALAVNARQSPINTPRPLPRPAGSSVLEYRLSEILGAGANIDRAMMQINRDHFRDMDLLFPFFENVLPGLYEREGRIVVATCQMGFFPYWMKQKFPDHNIEFVDTLGLCDRTVAHMPLKKDHTGVGVGRFVDEVLDGRVPLLTEYLASRNPNLVYFLGFDPALEERLETYARHGFLPVWKEVGAVVLFKETRAS